MKKALSTVLILMLTLSALAGCKMAGTTESSSGAVQNEIALVSREAGAGIRDVFSGLFDMIEEGEKDLLHAGAVLKNTAKDIVSHISSDAYALGYLPLSAVDENVKALSVDSVAPTYENVQNGKYKYTHNIYAVTLHDAEDTAEDFLEFLLSKEGQKAVTQSSLVSSGETESFSSQKPEGKMKIYCPDYEEELIKKLVSEYNKYNDKLKITVSVHNSKTALEKLDSKSDIAVVTRPLSDKEKKTYKETVFAKDGIAFVVHKNNSRTDIKSKNIKNIFTGNIKYWKDLD